MKQAFLYICICVLFCSCGKRIKYEHINKSEIPEGSPFSHLQIREWRKNIYTIHFGKAFESIRGKLIVSTDTVWYIPVNQINKDMKHPFYIRGITDTLIEPIIPLNLNYTTNSLYISLMPSLSRKTYSNTIYLKLKNSNNNVKFIMEIEFSYNSGIMAIKYKDPIEHIHIEFFPTSKYEILWKNSKLFKL